MRWVYPFKRNMKEMLVTIILVTIVGLKDELQSAILQKKLLNFVLSTYLTCKQLGIHLGTWKTHQFKDP